MSGQAEKCPLCSVRAALILDHSGKGIGGKSFDCPNCGRFFITETCEGCIPGKQGIDKAIVSHAVWKAQVQNGKFELDTGQWNNILANNPSLPTPAEQADNFILWLGSKQTDPAAFTKIEEYRFVQAAIGACSFDGVCYVLHELRQQELIETHKEIDHCPEGFDFRLTFRGWQYYEDLKRQGSNTREAFMAMPYGEDELDDIYEKHWKKAVKQTDFELKRLDEDPKAGIIDNRMIVDIRNARFVVVELTGHNYGAYWEAGFAEGLGKPVIYLCRKKDFDKVHFDTNHHLTIVWEPEDLLRAAKALNLETAFGSCVGSWK
jgi:hypothetical protein